MPGLPDSRLTPTNISPTYRAYCHLIDTHFRQIALDPRKPLLPVVLSLGIKSIQHGVLLIGFGSDHSLGRASSRTVLRSALN